MAITGAIRKVFAEVPSEFDPRKYLKRAMDAMVKLCSMRFNGFDTAGQASKINKVISIAEMAKRYAKGELKQKFA